MFYCSLPADCQSISVSKINHLTTLLENTAHEKSSTNEEKSQNVSKFSTQKIYIWDVYKFSSIFHARQRCDVPKFNNIESTRRKMEPNEPLKLRWKRKNERIQYTLNVIIPSHQSQRILMKFQENYLRCWSLEHIMA